MDEKKAFRLRVDSVVSDGTGGSPYVAFAHDGDSEPFLIRSAVPLSVAPGGEVLVRGILRPASPPAPKTILLPEGEAARAEAASILSGRVVVRAFRADGAQVPAEESADSGMTAPAASDLAADPADRPQRRLARPIDGGLELSPAGRPRDPALDLAFEVLDALGHPSVLVFDPLSVPAAIGRPPRLFAPARDQADGAGLAMVEEPMRDEIAPAAKDVPKDFSVSASDASHVGARWTTTIPASAKDEEGNWNRASHASAFSQTAALRAYDPFETSDAYSLGLALLDPRFFAPKAGFPPAFRRAQESVHEAAHGSAEAAWLAPGPQREAFSDAMSILVLRQKGFDKDLISAFADLRMSAALHPDGSHQTGPACLAALDLADRLDLPSDPPPSLRFLAAKASSLARESSIPPEIEAARSELLLRAGSSTITPTFLSGLLDILGREKEHSEAPHGRLLLAAFSACMRTFHDPQELWTDPVLRRSCADRYAADLEETAAALPKNAAALSALLTRENRSFPAAKTAGFPNSKMPVLRFDGDDLGSLRQRALDSMALSKWPAAALGSAASWFSKRRPSAVLSPAAESWPILGPLLSAPPQDRLAALAGLLSKESSAVLAALDQSEAVGARDGGLERAAASAARDRREAALSLVLDPEAMASVCPPGSKAEEAVRAAAAPPSPKDGPPTSADAAKTAKAAGRLGAEVDPRTLLRTPVRRFGKAGADLGG